MRACRGCGSEHDPLMTCGQAARIRASKAAPVMANDVANVASMANDSSTYRYRDAEARKSYQRELMRKRRAEKRA